MRVHRSVLARWPLVTVMTSGVAAAITASVLISLVSGLTAGYISHIFEPLPSLFAVSLLPAMLGAGLLRVIAGREQSATVGWLVSAAVAFLAGASGVVCQAALNAIQFGLERTNIVGYLVWAPAYGLAFIPITLPIALAVNGLMRRLSAESPNVPSGISVGTKAQD